VLNCAIRWYGPNDRRDDRSYPPFDRAAGSLALVCMHGKHEGVPVEGPPKPREDAMTMQLSRRGQRYLETAQTLLRNAQAMTDAAVAQQLKALAENYQRLAWKATEDDAAKALVRAQRAAAWEYV
jgi:hypothetical protein